MGEVYRARDPRLGRDVALKLLPPQFSSDPERLERFEREARALGSLNHPSIAAIYGVEESATALVLGLVEGETLAHRLRGGRALPAEIALRLARQIANALDAAHERGFIHRDLKPSNVALTRDGDAEPTWTSASRKISRGPRRAAMSTERCRTRSKEAILGTGRIHESRAGTRTRSDQRADVWAFGCLLYEMLSGRKAFQGETLSDTLSMTLTAEPDWSALPSSTPPGAVHLIRRCLEKDARRRLRGLGDIDLALDAPMPASRRTTSPWIAVAAGALLAAGAGATLAVNAFRNDATPPAPAPVHLENARISIQSGESGAFAVSRDSKRLVFIGTGADGVFRMWERSLNSIEMRPISGTEGQISANSSVFWSPDNQTIGFYADGAVKKISRAGGVPQVVCRVPSLAIGGTWNDRGDIVVGTPVGLLRCPAEWQHAIAVDGHVR